MITPQTKTQNILLWIGALVLALFLAFLGSLAKQLPGDAPINWRVILLDVITTMITLAPIVAAGLGLPRLGGEARATLINQIGTEKATEVLVQAKNEQE